MKNGLPSARLTISSRTAGESSPTPRSDFTISAVSSPESDSSVRR